MPRDWEVLAAEIASSGMLRNSSTIAVPPTGRSAPVVGASTGIEPLFRLTDPHLPGHLHPAVLTTLNVFDTRHDRYPVAVHVILTDGHGRVLLMRRAGSGYADGRLGLPAGHVDLGETPTGCAVREIAEELGVRLDASELEPGGTLFRRSLEPRVDIFLVARAWTGTPQIREPHECAELVWADPDDLPADALDFIGVAITGARTGRRFQEYGWQSVAG